MMVTDLFRVTSAEILAKFFENVALLIKNAQNQHFATFHKSNDRRGTIGLLFGWKEG